MKLFTHLWQTLSPSYRRLWKILGMAIASVSLTWFLAVNPVTTAIATTPSESLPVNETEQTALILADTESSKLKQIKSSNEQIVFPTNAETDAKIQVLVKELFEGFGAFNILIVFLITLGPIKLIVPFVKLTANATTLLRQQLALRSFGISTLVIFGVALICQRILKAWLIEPSVMLITTGIILFLVALRKVLGQYSTPTTNDAPVSNPSLALTFNPLVFPIILTPYGIAVVVTISTILSPMAIAPGLLFFLLFVVMLFNLGVMLFAHSILNFIKPVTLKVMGFVFGVMQVALGLDMIFAGIKIEIIALKFLVG